MSFVEKAITRAKGDAKPPSEDVRAGHAALFTLQPPLDAASDWKASAGSVSVESERFSEAGYLIADSSRPLVVAQFRNVRQRLLESLAQDTPSHVSLVAITSAVPGEGKSFVSLNLALSLAAQKKLNVTLVDFDLARPRMTSLFACEGKTGLADALTASRRLDEVAYTSNLPNFSFIPIGANPRADVELLSGQAVDQMVSSMRSLASSHLFVFDCPPMLANEDAKYIAHRSDITVMVVKADSTPQHWTAEALEKVGAKSRVTLLLNSRTGSAAESHYGYGATLKDYLGTA